MTLLRVPDPPTPGEKKEGASFSPGGGTGPIRVREEEKL